MIYESLQKIANSNVGPVYGPDRIGDIRDSFADITKAQTYLKYDPKVKIQDGLKRTFNWFKDNAEFILRQ